MTVDCFYTMTFLILFQVHYIRESFYKRCKIVIYRQSLDMSCNIRIVQGLSIHFTLYSYLENICSYITLLQADEFRKYIEDMAARSLRCVSFAYRPFELENVPNEEQRVNWVLPEDNLIFLAIVGIKVHAGESITIFYRSSVLSHFLVVSKVFKIL